MLITKEQQEALVNNYIKAGHSQDECIGFIDGLNKMLEQVSSLEIPSVVQKREMLVTFSEDWNLNNCDDKTHITDDDIENYLMIPPITV